MSTRDMLLDVMNDVDPAFIKEHMARASSTPVQRILRYAMPAAIYAAACIAVLLVIPHIIGTSPDEPPVKPDVPIVVETVVTSGTEEITESVTVTAAETEMATTETETTEAEATEEITVPPPTEYIPEEPVQTEPPVTETSTTTTTVTTTTTTTVTTPEPTPTTPAVTEPPVEEVITYPDPYISGKSETSVTKTLFGCEYTITIDKPKYEQGDIVSVVITLENKGKSKLYFYDGIIRDNFLDQVSFQINGKGSYIWEGATVPSSATLQPGGKWSYSTEFDTTGARITGVWSVEAQIEFSVYGTKYKESIEIEVPHDGVDENAFSPTNVINPFTGKKYELEFKGNGEITIILTHDASINWREYTPEDFPELELEKVETREPMSDDQDFINSNSKYRNFVSIYLKDKSDKAVVDAMWYLVDLDFVYWAGAEYFQ